MCRHVLISDKVFGKEQMSTNLIAAECPHLLQWYEMDSDVSVIAFDLEMPICNL